MHTNAAHCVAKQVSYSYSTDEQLQEDAAVLRAYLKAGLISNVVFDLYRTEMVLNNLKKIFFLIFYFFILKSLFSARAVTLRLERNAILKNTKQNTRRRSLNRSIESVQECNQFPPPLANVGGTREATEACSINFNLF